MRFVEISFANIKNEIEPTYEYGIDVNTYYETYDDLIDNFIKLVRKQVKYEIWKSGVCDDPSYIMFEYKYFKYGKINEPYLTFDKTCKNLLYNKILKALE